MANAISAEAATNIKFHNYDYGRQMARKGFVTYSLDWLGFGERNIAAKPHFYSGTAGRDPCNIYYLCATMLGSTVLAMNCHDAMRATDLVCDQPFVDPQRLGVMGLSLGGTMATWMPLVDERFKASDIMCYAGPWYDNANRTYNDCGSQVTPGVHALVDVSDLQGLIAPRPVLIELGLQDSCFEADYTQRNYRQIERIYAAAGAGDKLELDLFPGEHAWGGNKSEAFFRKHLRAEWPAPATGS
jgi:dienelactone hydrolase